MNFSKLKVKVKKEAAKRKTKLLRGDYDVRGKAQKVIGYAAKVGKNVADDVTPNRQTSSQLFPFSQPQQRSKSSKRKHHEEKRRRHHRSKRQPPQREPRNPYPLI